MGLRALTAIVLLIAAAGCGTLEGHAWDAGAGPTKDEYSGGNQGTASQGTAFSNALRQDGPSAGPRHLGSTTVLAQALTGPSTAERNGAQSEAAAKVVHEKAVQIPQQGDYDVVVRVIQGSALTIGRDAQATYKYRVQLHHPHNGVFPVLEIPAPPGPPATGWSWGTAGPRTASSASATGTPPLSTSPNPLVGPGSATRRLNLSAGAAKIVVEAEVRASTTKRGVEAAAETPEGGYLFVQAQSQVQIHAFVEAAP